MQVKISVKKFNPDTQQLELKEEYVSINSPSSETVIEQSIKNRKNKSQPLQIVEGIKHIVFKTEEVEALAKERLAHCNLCEWNSNGICNINKTTQLLLTEENYVWLKQSHKNNKIGDIVTARGCNCTLSLKVRSSESYCPQAKWLGVNLTVYKNKYNKDKDNGNF